MTEDMTDMHNIQGLKWAGIHWNPVPVAVDILKWVLPAKMV